MTPGLKPAGKPAWDVLVVGAGPAGSAAATLLAHGGHAVLVLEKEHFPRFHIGESLLPVCLPILARLGVSPSDAGFGETFVYKRGATFLCEETGRSRSFAFEEALPGCAPHAWHVERSRFDTVLRDRAVAAGAEVRHGTTVLDAGVDAERAWVTTAEGRLEARYLIDATGQMRLLARRGNHVRPYGSFGQAAVFTHFEGLGRAALEELGPDFDIRILLRPEGWGWAIPLPAGRLSVGLVSKDKISAEALEGLLAGSLVRRLTAGARRLETQLIGNFSYANAEPFGARFAAIGDAACFLDPVFSSGVALALRGAEGVADALAPALERGEEGAPRLLAAHGASMERAYRTFAGLIERFYHSNFARTVFLGEDLDRELRRGVLSVLAGDVWREGNPFQELLLRARRTRSAPSLERPSV